MDKDDLAIPPPDYSTSSRAFSNQTAGTFKQRPYSVAVPAFSQVSSGLLAGTLSGDGCPARRAWEKGLVWDLGHMNACGSVLSPCPPTVAHASLGLLATSKV